MSTNQTIDVASLVQIWREEWGNITDGSEYSGWLEAKLAAAVQELAAIKVDCKHLHRRKCWGCGKVHWHADAVTPYVCCPECGSQDTRRIKDPKGARP